MRTIYTKLLVSITTIVCLSGCLLAAAGAGGEAAYVGTQKDRTVGETIDDQSITASIKTQLLADSNTPGLKINVDTLNKNVILRGYVKTQKEADAALRIARETSGVRTAESRLVVDPQV